MLQVEAALGRVYSDQEDLEDAQVAVISHGFWLRRFGGDPAILGGLRPLDSGTREITGIMPPDFAMPSKDTDIWIPMNLVPSDAGNRGAHNRMAIARLKPGVSVAQAQLDMRAIARQLQAEYPKSYPEGSGWSVSVLPLRERLVGDVRDQLLMLMGAVAFLWAIAGANVASLLLARATERARELVTRVALGAPRARLFRSAAAGLGEPDDGRLDGSLAAGPRFSLAVLAVFAAAAVALAAIGTCGVMAFAVSRRTRELGIRAALGADPRSLMGMVLRERLTLAASATLADAVLAMSAASYLERVLYRFRVDDPFVFLAVALIVFVVATAAAWLSAWRAMRVDPVIALRSD